MTETTKPARTHELKTWPVPFEAVLDGSKPYEIRKADRLFAVGDTLLLREWDPTTSAYSGRQVERTVTYLTPGGEWGLPPGMCVLGLVAGRASPEEGRLRLKHLEIDETGETRATVSITREQRENFALMMASILAEQNAPNYVEMSVVHPDGRRFVVTVQNAAGLTPHQFRLKAEAELAALRAPPAPTETREDALRAKLARARKELDRLASWLSHLHCHRQECHAHDEDADHEPRPFIDEEEWDRVEKDAGEQFDLAMAVLQETDSAAPPPEDEGAREPSVDGQIVGAGMIGTSIELTVRIPSSPVPVKMSAPVRVVFPAPASSKEG